MIQISNYCRVKGHIRLIEISPEDDALLRPNLKQGQFKRLWNHINKRVVYEKDNLITINGYTLLARQLAWAGRKNKNPFEVHQIWATSNAETVAETDETAQFCTFGTNAIITPAVVRFYPTGISVVYLARVGPPEGNFGIKKIGLVSKNRILLAETNIDYTKASGTIIFIEYSIIFGGA